MGRRSSKCFVNQCHITDPKTEKVCMFGVPKDEDLKRQWSDAIGRQDKELCSRDVVCERHFSPDEIIRVWKSRSVTHTYAKPKLKDDAVPSIFPDDLDCTPKKTVSTLIKKKRKIAEICDGDGDVLAQIPQQNPPEICDKNPHIFNDIYNKQTVPILPASWTCCPFTNEDGKYIIFTENAVLDHRPLVTRQVLLNEDNKLTFFHNFNPLNATLLNLKEKLTNLNELDDILSNFKLLKCCPGGPEKDQFEVSYNHISFVDAKTQKWRHKKCSYMIFANDILCSFCKYLCDINVFKYSEKKTRRKQDGEVDARKAKVPRMRKS